MCNPISSTASPTLNQSYNQANGIDTPLVPNSQTSVRTQTDIQNKVPSTPNTDSGSIFFTEFDIAKQAWRHRK